MNYSEFEKLTDEFNNSLIWEVQKDNTYLISNWHIRPFSEFASIYKNTIYLVKTTDREVKLFTSKPTKVIIQQIQMKKGNIIMDIFIKYKCLVRSTLNVGKMIKVSMVYVLIFLTFLMK